jgi:uncharacterized protein YgfB (UPF0149 family)
MQVTFAEFAKVLQSSASAVDAAEGHGCLCGALCVSADYTLERWLEELIPEEEGSQLQASDTQVLQLIFDEAARTLRGDDMEFAPLLPEEDEPLERRANTLAQWCRGFLYGFGSARPLEVAKLPASVDEILRDIAHIGGAEVDVGAAGEEEEQAYVEVFEYLRAGVQLLHDELTELRADPHHDPDADGDADYDPEADPHDDSPPLLDDDESEGPLH